MDMDTERIVMERRIKALRRSMERALYILKDGVDVAAHELESALAEDDDTKAKGRL